MSSSNLSHLINNNSLILSSYLNFPTYTPHVFYSYFFLSQTGSNLGYTLYFIIVFLLIYDSVLALFSPPDMVLLMSQEQFHVSCPALWLCPIISSSTV